MHLAHHSNAAIELALTGSLLLTMFAGIVNVGFGVYEAMQVQNAAKAGALYAARNGWDADGIAGAVIDAAYLEGISATPAPSQFCGCPSGAAVITAVCTAPCSGGTAPGIYVRVHASLPHQQIVPYFGFGMPSTLTGQSLIRLQ